MTAIERLRAAVKLFDQCNEDFNCRFTTSIELLWIWDAHHRCGWDFYPDQWTERQILAALTCFEAPDWNADETPKVPKAFEKGGMLYEKVDDAEPDEAEEPGERD